VRNVWPWWWAVPVALVTIFRDKKNSKAREWTLWAIVSFSMFLAFFVPLSLVSYKLPHYLHPTYLPLAPLAAKSLLMMWQRWVPRRADKYLGAYTRWALLLLAFVLLWSPVERISTSSNRGQEFVRVATDLENLNSECKVLVHVSEMDAYRMEAFALWYWKGRGWEIVDQYYPSRIAVPAMSAFWRPQTATLWAGEGCQP
jgi:hypothetical protein